MKFGTVNTGNPALCYETSGAGQPLVLLHDGLLDCRIRDEQSEIFSESYETVRYDRWSTGSRASSGGSSHIEELDLPVAVGNVALDGGGL